MNLSAPAALIFLLSPVHAILAVLAAFMPIPLINDSAFWVVVTGYVVLLVEYVSMGL